MSALRMAFSHTLQQHARSACKRSGSSLHTRYSTMCCAAQCYTALRAQHSPRYSTMCTAAHTPYVVLNAWREGLISFWTACVSAVIAVTFFLRRELILTYIHHQGNAYFLTHMIDGVFVERGSFDFFHPDGRAVRFAVYRVEDDAVVCLSVETCLRKTPSH